VQSGNNEVLKKMNRGYTREWYLNRIAAIKRIVPDIAISTDIITGFCGETEEQHKETLELMDEVGFEMAFMFKYSERPKTLAERKYEDDIPEEIKGRRLREVIDLQMAKGHSLVKRYLGRTMKVLVEGVSKRSEEEYFGRISQNTVVVFPKKDAIMGTFREVKINDCTSITLKGELV
jgi:tRNA-2-methylthio-N6-dimethylallyladenosine synthase